MVELRVKWSIEAPSDVLLDGMHAAELNPNALVPGNLDAELVFPSFFCPNRSSWMKVLAYLYVRNIDFRLFLFAVEDSGSERWRYLLQPGMDSETLDLLRAIDARETAQLASLEHKMERVAQSLRATALKTDDLI